MWSAGKDGRNSLACAACGCHRNFHRRVLPGEEERDPQKEREEGAGNYLTSICNIERVAHELMAAANRVIPLSQDPLCYRKGRARDLSIKERNTMAKISIENLDHIAKVVSHPSSLGVSCLQHHDTRRTLDLLSQKYHQSQFWKILSPQCTN